MKSKTVMIILAVLAMAALLAYIIFGGPGPTPREPGPSPTNGPKVTVPDGKAGEQKPQISPEQRRDLAQILQALKIWEANYKAKGDKIIDPRFLSIKLQDRLGDSPPYGVQFSKGSIIYLLGKYLRFLNELRIEDKGDLATQTELSDMYHRLKNEPDQVSVSVINTSGKTIDNNGGRIPPGGTMSFTSQNRKLGEAETGEGAFSFLGTAFPFNYQLPRQQTWDEDRYDWKKSGVSSYTLRVKK